MLKVPLVTFGPWYEGVGADFSGGDHAAQHWCTEHGERQQSRHLPVDRREDADFFQSLTLSILSWSTSHSLSGFNEVWRSCAALMSLGTADWSTHHILHRTHSLLVYRLLSVSCQYVKTKRITLLLPVIHPVLGMWSILLHHLAQISAAICSIITKLSYIKKN